MFQVQHTDFVYSSATLFALDESVQNNTHGTAVKAPSSQMQYYSNNLVTEYGHNKVLLYSKSTFSRKTTS